MNRKVIYTALFGPRGRLQEPRVHPGDWDLVCFTDRREFKSKVWQVCWQRGLYADPARSAKIFKILPHRYFPDHEVSLWMDGNMNLTKSPDDLAENYLSETNLAVFNHAENTFDSRDCIYEEARALVRRPWKDDPELVKSQVAKYRGEGYPEHYGLAVCQVLLRRHMEADVVNAMELWWRQIDGGSKRDQLSFNYVAWKTGLPFTYLPGDSRNNEWFQYTQHEHVPLWRRARNKLAQVGRKLARSSKTEVYHSK